MHSILFALPCLLVESLEKIDLKLSKSPVRGKTHVMDLLVLIATFGFGTWSASTLSLCPNLPIASLLLLRPGCLNYGKDERE